MQCSLAGHNGSILIHALGISLGGIGRLSQCSGALTDIVSCKFCGLEDDSLCGIADLGI